MVTVSMRKIVISIRRNVWEEFGHVYDNDEEVSWSGGYEKLWRTCIYRGFLVDRYLSLSSIIAIIELTISPLSYRFIYVPNSCLLTLIISNSTITLFSIIFDLLPFETLLPSMPASPRRYISPSKFLASKWPKSTTKSWGRFLNTHTIIDWCLQQSKGRHCSLSSQDHASAHTRSDA